MSEHLRTDYDRMVGESYKEYAARMRGRMLAAEHDRDALAAEVRQLREELESVRKTHELVVNAGRRLGAQVRRVRELLKDEGRHQIQMGGNWVKWSDIADALDERTRDMSENYEEPCQHRTTRTERKSVPDEHGTGRHVDEAVYCTDKCRYRIR